MSRHYRPSNGTEGMDFMAKWCSVCTKDEDGDCPILGRSMCVGANDPQYPKELTYDDKGKPCCTAFVDFEEAKQRAQTNAILGIHHVEDHPDQTRMF